MEGYTMPTKPYPIFHKSGEGLGKFLGELELVVMEMIWAREHVSVSDIVTALHAQGRMLAYTSVMTVMNRLTEKGWLIAEKQSKAYSYRATQSREAAEAAAVGEVVRTLLRDFGDVAVVQFLKESDDIAPEQLARLAELGREGDSQEHEQE
jgi:predicted transcriptional regulator